MAPKKEQSEEGALQERERLIARGVIEPTMKEYRFGERPELSPYNVALLRKKYIQLGIINPKVYSREIH